MKRWIVGLLILPLLCFANQLKTTDVVIGAHHLTAEIADTSVTQIKGLQGHPALSNHAGMLFVFPHSSKLYFWMKDMDYPIDIVWIDEHHHVISVNANVPICSKEPCLNYSPASPARYVLEIKSGLAAELDIQPGTLINFNLSTTKSQA